MRVKRRWAIERRGDRTMRATCMLGRKLRRGSIAQGAVRPLGVIGQAVLFHEHLRLGHTREDLPVQELVLEAAVERLAVRVLPGAPGLDVEGRDPRAGQPLLHDGRDELRPVVGAKVHRLAMHAEQRGEQRDHVLGPDASLDQDRVRLSGELIQDRQQLQPSPVLRLIHDEIVAPDMVLVLGTPAPAAVLAAAQALPFPLHLRDAKPLVPPESLYSFAIHSPPLPAQERPDPPIPVARIASRQRHEPIAQGAVPLRPTRHKPLARSRLLQHSACPTLSDTQQPLYLHHSGPPPGRAQKFPLATSRRMLRSTACSATIFFSRAFSFSSSFSRFAWPAFMPPYCARQRWNVFSLMPSGLLTAATVAPVASCASASRSFRMISSGVCRFRFIESPPARMGGSDSHNTWIHSKGSGQWGEADHLIPGASVTEIMEGKTSRHLADLRTGEHVRMTFTEHLRSPHVAHPIII